MTPLPAGWTWSTVGALAEEGPTNGYSGPVASDATGSPTLRLSATTQGRCILNESTTKRMVETVDPASSLWLRPGDLLIQRSNTIDLVGTAAIYDGPAGAYVYPDLMMRIRFSEPTTARWIWRYANSPDGRNYFRSLAAGSSGSMPKISGAKLREMPVPVPPLVEQRRIAAILDEADAIRRKRREALGLLDDLLRSTFLQMFGDPVTNSKGWPTKTLGQVGTFVGGGTPSRAEPTFFTGEICWATCKDMKGDRLRDTEEHISELAIARSATKLVRAGALLIVVKSKVLMHRLPVAIAAVDTCFGQDLKAFLPSEEWPAEYVATHLRFGQQPLLDQARGANTEGLTLDHLRGYRLLSPPSAARTQFAQLERAITDEKFQMERAIQESETLFTTLLHRAFTGAL